MAVAATDGAAVALRFGAAIRTDFGALGEIDATAMTDTGHERLGGEKARLAGCKTM